MTPVDGWVTTTPTSRVAVQYTGSAVYVTRWPSSAVLVAFTPDEWDEFLGGVRDGVFDLGPVTA